MKEGAGLVAQYGTIALPNQAPNPNAAKVFINWLLSREGQLAFQKALAKAPDSEAPDSFRIDIPKDDVPLDNRLVEGRRYLDVGRPEWQDLTPIFQLVKEVMAGK